MISFVILTDGRKSRLKCLDVIIEAILANHISEASEIIVVGPHSDVPKGCIHIPAIEPTNNAQLSMKINIGIRAATNEYVVTLHDDMVPHERMLDWFDFNWHRTGEPWDIIAPDYFYPDLGNFRGIMQIAGEAPIEHPLWTLGGPTGHHPIPNDKNWDVNCYASGECYIIRRSAWERCNFQYDNDHRITRSTPDAYDVEFGHRANSLGLITRFDPRIKMYHLRLPSFTESLE